jgi:hypothetical protein
MPTAEQFTPAFVGAFISRCHERGLTKEAATHLLTVAATIAAHQNPGFAAGFNEKMSEGGLEKSAWAMAGKLLTGGLALGGAAGGAAYGYNKIRDGIHNYNRQPWGDVPLAGTPEAWGDLEAAKLRAASTGVAELNRGADQDGKRRYELEQLVQSGGPGAAAAITELQRLRRSPYAGQRARYGQELEQYHSGVNNHLNTVQQDLSQLNGSRGSWWNRTRDFFGFPRDFDGEERNLVAQQARLAEQARLSQRLRDRLHSGATSFSEGPMSQETLQSRFFPTR